LATVDPTTRRLQRTARSLKAPPGNDWWEKNSPDVASPERIGRCNKEAGTAAVWREQPDRASHPRRHEPEVMIGGRDQQIEAAVRELMKKD